MGTMTKDKERIIALEQALRRSIYLLEDAQEQLQKNTTEINRCKYFILMLSRTILVGATVTLLITLIILL